MSDRSDLAQDAKAQLKDLGDAAKARMNAEAQARADAARHAAADEIQAASNAASAAAEQLDSGSLQAQVAHQIADQIEAIATHLRRTNVNGLVTQTSEFARRNPLLFVGGAAALGFVATRFLKARDPQPGAFEDDGDPWQSSMGPRPEDYMPRSGRSTHLADISGSAGHG